MDSNAFLTCFGLDGEDFKPTDALPIKTNHGFEWTLEEKKKEAFCPVCGLLANIHSKYWMTLKVHETREIEKLLDVRRIVYRCPSCGKTFTLPIKGHSSLTSLIIEERNLIYSSFLLGMTFSEIGLKFHMSTARAVQLFDEMIPEVRRQRLPEIMCIDEFSFKSNEYEKYACIMMDLRNGMPIDIIPSRQQAWLDDYFRKIPEGERKSVKYIISDMFEGYARATRLWFPNATLVVDRFHVVLLLRNAVNSLRTRAMKGTREKTPEYRFMKTHWNEFLKAKFMVEDKYYGANQYGEVVHFDEMIMNCLQLSPQLRDGWSCLQDLLRYTWGIDTYTQASKEVDFVSTRLIGSGIDELIRVGETYKRWKAPIATALAKNQTGLKLTNGKMEGLNNQIKTIIKKAYGYRNFERFRKRALLILWNRKSL